MKAYKSLIKYSLSQNANVSVFDGASWEVKRSSKYTEIIKCIESVEIAYLRIRNANGVLIGWACIIPDLIDDETVADMTETDFLKVWEKTQH